MADENDILDSWEELEDNNVLDKKLQGIKITNCNKSSSDPMSNLKEEGSRTQYSPQVRILKRQPDTPEQDQTYKTKEVTQQKSLQQREAEYKEARLRILGQEYSGGDNNCNNSANVQPEPSQSRPVRLQKQVEEIKLQSGKVQLLREPKGPDGTNGFDHHR